ncbi:MAG: hypothetical protein ACO3DJ_00980 [Alphaproteobacteria bacterium]
MSGGAPSRDLERDFGKVLGEEVAWINDGRAGAERLAPPPASGPPPVQGAGLALSGGGIRSAAFCLGAMQALDLHLGRATRQASGIRFFDWMSTVSGGGYLGASARVGMERLGGRFPFSPEAGRKDDSPAVGHLRNHSRYLVPRGMSDAVGSVVVVLRGLVANLIRVGAAILLLAGLTGMMNPDQRAFSTPDFLGFEGVPVVSGWGHFAFTKLATLLFVLHLLAWGTWLSFRKDGAAEFSGRWYLVARALAVATLLTAFMEMQPFAVAALFKIYGNEEVDTLYAKATVLVSSYAPHLASAAAVLSFLGRHLGLEAQAAGTGAAGILRGIAAAAASWAVALILPLVVWAGYLHVTLWTDIGFLYRPSWLAPAVHLLCSGPGAGAIAAAAELALDCGGPRSIAAAFVAVGVLVLALLGLALAPNANSLHRLYRDRLSKAFLFDPAGLSGLAPGQDPRPCGTMRLHELTPGHGPLLLVNCALNVQASRNVNRRGRNADFFFFSPVRFGAQSTGYGDVRRADALWGGGLPDIGSAVAISGAAVSANMGASMARRMAPTLALLNVRLGYWMANPASLGGTAPSGRYSRGARLAQDVLNWPMIAEIFSLLDEHARRVYLTDGGHVENLGLYELLRRRVRTIVVVDAEADPRMEFGSLVRLQRFARIDLGVRIELPWQPIREATLAVMRGEAAPASAPHVAVGTIDYGDATGTLVYVKSSLTGDENDYIRDYARRNPSFPHETTGDQFFSEEQFEVYRALGFHAVNGAFTRPGMVASTTPLPGPADFAGQFKR